jgi:hypothetical protein
MQEVCRKVYGRGVGAVSVSGHPAVHDRECAPGGTFANQEAFLDGERVIRSRSPRFGRSRAAWRKPHHSHVI